MLEQRVQGVEAFRSWRLLVTKFGTPAPARRLTGCGYPVGSSLARHPVGSSIVRTSIPGGCAP